MEQKNTIFYADIEEAQKNLRHWKGNVDSIEHLGNSANAVFRF